MKAFFKGQSGEGYVDIAIVILIIFVLMASLLAVFPILSAQQSLNSTVRQIVRTVEITGNAGTEVDTLLTQLTSAKPDSLSWQTSWKDAANKNIQLKTPFTVTATKVVPLVNVINLGIGKGPPNDWRFFFYCICSEIVIEIYAY